MIPTPFDITFKILEYDFTKDLLVVQCWSSILKYEMDHYQSLNLGCQWFTLNDNIKDQITERCKNIIEQRYLQEQVDEFIKNNTNISMTKTFSHLNLKNKETLNTKIKFL